MKYFSIKFSILFLMILSVSSQLCAQIKFDPEIQKYNFNSQWLLNVGDVNDGKAISFKDENWKKVTLPHAFNEDEAFKVAIDSLSTSIVWYRKHFKLPKQAKGKKIFLEFEGIRFGGEFFINGQSVGIHENGVMAFGLDISEFAKFGNEDNVFSARIDNSWKYKEKATGQGYQWNDKNFNANYGGIPKNVNLYIKEKVYQTLPLYSNLGTTGTYIYAKDFDIKNKSAVIHAESEVFNEFSEPKDVRFETVVKDQKGKVVKTIKGTETKILPGQKTILKAEAQVNDLEFWSWGFGYLYTVYTDLYVNNKLVDRVQTKTGFRKTKFEKGMVYLNDRVIQLKGYAQRTSNEWPAVGMSVPAWLSDFSNKLMVESNANLVRWMHVTPWKQDVESCDRVGLMQAMPAGDAEKDVSDRRWQQRTLLMRDAIIYNRNNPSIVFYESGNESISEEHMAEMKAIRNQYDPFGGRAIGSREMLDSEIAEYGGEMLYINKSADIPMWATEYCRDEALRKYWNDYSYPYHKDGDGTSYYRSTVTNKVEKREDAQVYNRNQDTFTKETVTRWYDYYRVRPGTGDRVSSGGVNIIFSDTNTHYRGVENYRRSGEVDAMRIPKDGFFAHQVMWDGWVDVENYRTHIVGHWNYPANTQKDVFVVSSGENVELFINGKSYGFGEKSDGFWFTFKNIKFQPGKIEAVSYNNQNKELSRDKIQTAGKPHSIKLKKWNAADGFKADAADLVLVEVEVVDEQGNRCPLANNLISFELNGPAEWRGGIAKGKDNYILSKNLPVESGINRVLVRSTLEKGEISLKAKAEGLISDEIKFNSIQIDEKDGLSAYKSGDFQAANLSRGKTPSTPSYKISRKSVEIEKAEAGSNQEKAKFSFDDNELNQWESQGDISKAFITYTLKKEALISEVEMKLVSWRNKSYPIKISVDGKVVYQGMTPKTLGYFSIPFAVPTKGKAVKVELMGDVAEKDAFGGVVEITGKKELQEGKKANRSLGIVEIEVYEKAD
ncbi:DUF4982 domain-containing protein [Chryseobacterium formosus]|uniref:DUF4982 domain-containing protein n=1 Tax=Chryseobacterium formosus TaxID=1537363 RepID=A0ABT3XXG7_9FLAO|nr:DUF4982 domain-containing protein [Chryseobacterium formosus]MCX8526366.1 DUF4982 domain-containing protein [Chryseobacterium formosus]